MHSFHLHRALFFVFRFKETRFLPRNHHHILRGLPKPDSLARLKDSLLTSFRHSLDCVDHHTRAHRSTGLNFHLDVELTIASSVFNHANDRANAEQREIPERAA